jgi:hypothetical protein
MELSWKLEREFWMWARQPSSTQPELRYRRHQPTVPGLCRNGAFSLVRTRMVIVIGERGTDSFILD